MPKCNNKNKRKEGKLSKKSHLSKGKRGNFIQAIALGDEKDEELSYDQLNAFPLKQVYRKIDAITKLLTHPMVLQIPHPELDDEEIKYKKEPLLAIYRMFEEICNPIEIEDLQERLGYLEDEDEETSTIIEIFFFEIAAEINDGGGSIDLPFEYIREIYNIVFGHLIDLELVKIPRLKKENQEKIRKYKKWRSEMWALCG
eukprot:283677-Rhodomonas_salina.1